MSNSVKEQTDLILCIISVSNYKNPDWNLTYAAKDGRDILKIFSKQRHRYDSIYHYTLFDTQVTIEKARSLFESINSDSDDKVVIFLSGHGLLDSINDFYFASHNVDFDNPRDGGISFDTLQYWISKIPAQRKLLLIDACHSGLVSNERIIKVKSPSNDQEITLKRTEEFASKGVEVVSHSKSKLSLQNSFELMKELFSTFSSYTGTETVTAASGDGWALESDRWKNGAFTYTIKKGLLDYEADKNLNGVVTLSELKEYVMHEVQKLTNGAQKPTSREKNGFLDWQVWF